MNPRRNTLLPSVSLSSPGSGRPPKSPQNPRASDLASFYPFTFSHVNDLQNNGFAILDLLCWSERQRVFQRNLIPHFNTIHISVWGS